jgi:hypothetical protein
MEPRQNTQFEARQLIRKGAALDMENIDPLNIVFPHCSRLQIAGILCSGIPASVACCGGLSHDEIQTEYQNRSEVAPPQGYCPGYGGQKSLKSYLSAFFSTTNSGYPMQRHARKH